MKTIYAFLATGFEEIEALTVIDICRRAELNVKTISITGERAVVSCHGIPVVADQLFDDTDFSDADMLFLPGGMPGAANLDGHEGLRQLILRHHAAALPLSAICAAPMVYGHLGLLKGINATCYPGFESELEGATPTGALTVCDGQFLLGKGPAAAFELGYAIVRYYCGVDAAQALSDGMIYTQLLS